ncbi:general amino acid permease agp2 [Vermiconidia calcicola]|uniref:General amino acid permease agp2 n=1 Tax=Vermiconidia calcicola TaxID=1690605 RepID=A0ACC3MF29_9PEZI|nr:general amino acid permease agp2 [Vermiconidia calcicola]
MASKMFEKLPFGRHTTSDSSGSPKPGDTTGLPPSYDHDTERRNSAFATVSGLQDTTHRGLKARHIQLIGIGGTIGTALYVQIGRSLINGGPASLFMAFTIWCFFILAVTISMAEMATYLPISSPFIRFAGRYVDESFGFAAGWNFFIFQAIMVPFEITACNLILTYWTTKIPVGVVIAVIIALYGIINVMAVQWYGETEFWAALGKMLLIIGLIIYTFITMVGGNPLGDAYGFRYWKNPGSFTWLYYDSKTGYFLGFLQCLIQAGFTIAGPDYVSMAAGEAENPRVILPKAYNAVFYRLTAFFVLGSLCVGINVPYDDETLIAAFEGGAPGAAASPYVVSMIRLRIQVLPHIVNALILTAAFSAGLSYLYCSSRCLLGLALEGKAPKVFARTAKNGVPVYAVGLVLLISLLSFLQLSNSTATVLGWFINIITASQLINFTVMCYTYTRWFYALKAQGISRDTLPYKGWFQPYAAYVAMAGCIVVCLVGGYGVFLNGYWDTATFIFSYFTVALFPVMFFGWKLLKKTHWKKLHEIDLKGEVEEIEEYTRNFVPQPSKNAVDKWFNIIFGGINYDKQLKEMRERGEHPDQRQGYSAEYAEKTK